MPQSIRTAAAVIAAAATLSVLALIATQARAATGPYVALGDSYTSAPLVPNPTGNPILCGRSTSNYPQDVARSIAPSSFTDASCSGATTTDMTQSQSLEGGLQTNPPQFNALKSNDAIVTLGIGGNDAGLISVAEKCGETDVLDPFATPCKNYYASRPGGDPNPKAVAAAGPKVASAINGIHAKAPSARVLVVGYPDGLPTNGSSCWPLVPMSAGDIKYFNGLETQLNSVLKQTAAANKATYVDTFTSSVGHDACKPAGTAWINGFVPTSPAFPLHPNEAGEANMAKQVEAALS